MLKPKQYEHLLGRTPFSKPQLLAHFKLYEGYVAKLNAILGKLGKADRAGANYSFAEYSELKRREPVAYNGMVLHELYFDALGRAGRTRPAESVKERIAESYGSWNGWLKDMKAAASSCHGWALLVFDPVEKKLKTNMVQSEHHVGLFVNTPILIALDVWEHAYTIQFGINKADYLKAFFDSLDWEVVSRRFLATA
ncbi:MAG: Fe-Mn family superoxide dismutase [Candidatus Omnitrophota bacterium]|nr:Fe-Mn family superoxide dismutase [Candidatus Omnitrophota bacterium]